jgi:nucleoside phosphorylase
MIQFRAVASQEVENLKVFAKILIVTATDVETNALHAHFRPLQPRGRCLKMIAGNQTYYIGRLGRYGVIHVQCQMGSVTPGASGYTVTEAINHWDVKAVVMVGIAFGVDRQKQRVGDVLVSKTVIPYEIKRVGKKQNVHRNPIPPCGSILLNRFSNGRNWKYILPRQQIARLIPAQLLSGESLIDNESYRAQLLATFPQADGGEMEGVGVFSAAHQKGVEWILVKAICDFADGRKNRSKKANQTTAATSAVSLCVYVFSQADTFEAFGCTDLSNVATQTKSSSLNLKTALFEVYDEKFECAYLDRAIDQDLKAILKHQGIWVTGPSGCGKTSALRRNLSLIGKPIHFIDLSKCIGSPVSDLFLCIHSELADLVGLPMQTQNPETRRKEQTFHIEQIAKLIENKIKEETYLFIDEIPVEGQDFKSFFGGIAALVITLGNLNVNNTPFILASINDPTKCVLDIHCKLRERMRMLSMSSWSESEICSLLNLVCVLLPLELSKMDRDKVINAANGSPRALKMILKYFCMFRNIPDWTLDRVISEQHTL